jgi:hypothetical protein
VPAWGQGERCRDGKDLVGQALERVTRQCDRSAFEDALQLLKHAVSECSELGDAWYYRSLMEQRLGHEALAKYALAKARFNGSEAWQEGLNPLVPATPSGRGFGAVARPGDSGGAGVPATQPSSASSFEAKMSRFSCRTSRNSRIAWKTPLKTRIDAWIFFKVLVSEVASKPVRHSWSLVSVNFGS